jgi:O-antigen ligase
MMNAGDALSAPQPVYSMQQSEDRVAVTWLYLMLASYFYVVPVGTLSITGPTDLRLYDVLFLAGGLFVLLPNLGKLNAAGRTQRWSRPYFLLALWVALTLAQTLSSKGLMFAGIAAGRIMRFTAYGTAALAVIALVQKRTTLYRMLGLFYILIAAEGVLSTLQSLGIVPYLFPERWATQYTAMPVGTLGPHHLQMGVVAVMAISVGIGLLQTDARRIAKLFVALGIGPLIYATFAVESRSGWLGLVVLSLYVALELLKIRRLGRLVVVGLLVVFGIVFFLRVGGSGVERRAHTSFRVNFTERVETGGVSNVSPGRGLINADILNDIVRHPRTLLIGAGAQNAVTVLSYGSAAHNNYLQVLIEAGLPGFFLYLWLLASIWRGSSGVKRRGLTDQARGIAFGFRGAFLVVLVLNLFNEAFWMQYATFSLTGQIMFLTAIALHPAWTQDDDDRPLEPSCESSS